MERFCVLPPAARFIGALDLPEEKAVRFQIYKENSRNGQESPYEDAVFLLWQKALTDLALYRLEKAAFIDDSKDVLISANMKSRIENRSHKSHMDPFK